MLRDRDLVEARKGQAGGRVIDLLLHQARIEIVAVNADQSMLASVAWRKYGKVKPDTL